MIKRTKNESLSIANAIIKKFDTAEVLLSLVDEGKISAEELLLECVKRMDDDSRKSIIGKVRRTANTRTTFEGVADGDVEPVPRNKRYFNFIKIAKDYGIQLDAPEWRSPKLCVINGQCDGSNFDLNESDSTPHTIYFKIQYSDTQFYLTVGLDDIRPVEYPKFSGTTSGGEFYYKVLDLIRRMEKTKAMWG